jgi:hypothetical protein
MKCVFNPPGAAVCQRCQQSGRTCVVGGELRKNSEYVIIRDCNVGFGLCSVGPLVN